MSQIVLNGKPYPVVLPCTLAAVVAQLEVPVRFACELNGHIVPKSRLDQTLLAEADQVEIVSAIGGG